MSKKHERTIQNAFARLKDTFTEQFVSHGDLRIRTLYKQHDNANKTILLLHGWGASSEVWFPLLETIKNERVHILLIDLPGFGKSTTPEEALTLDDFCDIVSAVLDEHEREEATIFGHSFGGQVATKYAVTSPHRVNKLVLINSASVRKNRATLTTTLATLLRPLFKLPLLRDTKDLLLRKISGMDYQVNPKMYSTLKKIVAEDMRPILDQITQPTLIVWGEADTVTPKEQAYAISDRIPQALVVMLPGAGHFSFIDARHEAAESIMSFVEHGM